MRSDGGAYGESSPAAEVVADAVDVVRPARSVEPCDPGWLDAAPSLEAARPEDAGAIDAAAVVEAARPDDADAIDVAAVEAARSVDAGSIGGAAVEAARSVDAGSVGGAPVVEAADAATPVDDPPAVEVVPPDLVSAPVDVVASVDPLADRGAAASRSDRLCPTLDPTLVGGGDVVDDGRTIGLWVVVRDRRGKALAASALDGGVAGAGTIGADNAGRDPDADAAGIPGIVPLAGTSRSITDSVTEFEGSIGCAICAPEIDAATSCSSITGGGGSAVAAAMLSSATGRAHGDREEGRGRG